MRVILEHLTKVYDGGVTALDDLSLQISDGEFFALLGPSGCGKTTLLRTIAGLETATSGRVQIGDRDVTTMQPGARDVAMVFQDYALFPHMTVQDNIAYPLRIKKVGKAERRAKAIETGDELTLTGLMERRPGQLSGGQQQRVALARAVAAQPTVFLFDEPLSNLDARLRLEARTFLKKLQRDLDVTTVFVTHDQAEALALADRIAVMDAGRIQQVGTAREVFGRPATVFVAGFIGSTPMNLLPGECVAGAGDSMDTWSDVIDVAGFRLGVPDEIMGMVTPGDKVTVGIRPEYLRLTNLSNDSEPQAPGSAGQSHGFTGTTLIVENLGTSSLVTVRLSGELTMQATVTEGQEPEIGAPVHLAPRPGRVLLYRADDGDLIAE